MRCRKIARGDQSWCEKVNALGLIWGLCRKENRFKDHIGGPVGDELYVNTFATRPPSDPRIINHLETDDRSSNIEDDGVRRGIED
jgi:hypothetical protein